MLKWGLANGQEGHEIEGLQGCTNCTPQCPHPKLDYSDVSSTKTKKLNHVFLINLV